MEDKKIEQSLTVVKKELATIADLGELKITSQKSLDISAEGLKIINKVSKIIDQEKESWIAPLKEQIERHKERYKPFEEKVLEIKNYLKGEQTKYLAKLRKEEEEAKAKADAELAEAMSSGENVEKVLETTGKKIEKVENKSSAIKTYTYTGVRITDKAKLPLQFLIPDEKLIKETLQSGGNVEGAELFTEERVRS